MDRKRQIIWRLRFFLFFFLLLLFPERVKAARAGCEVTIPVQIQTAGEKLPKGMEYRVLLEAVTEAAPMPSKAEGSRTEAGEIILGPITYTVPGDYQYRIRQTTEDKKRFTFDREVYTVTVRILNKEDGGFRSEMWAVREGTESKSDEIRFQNRYQAPKSKHHHSDKSSETAAPVPVQALQNLIAPKTGDETESMMWIILLVSAVLGLGWITTKRKAEKKYGENR